VAAAPAAGQSRPCPPAKWPTRLHRQLAYADHPRAQFQAEEEDRRRWIQEACKILVQDKHPVANMGDGSGGVEYLKRVFGGRRGRTLRLRVRTWKKVRTWMVAAGRPALPQGDEGAKALVVYLDELAMGTCGRSVPRAIVASLAMFESCGGVKAGERVASHTLVTSVVADLERELALGALRPRRKAPHYLVSLIAAFEDKVCNTAALPYQRLYAWWKLVRVWGCMRFDDILHVEPAGVSLVADCLILTIRSSKTTGAGRRVEVVYAYVAKGACVKNPEWLVLGLALLEKMAGHVVRDYLLPLPTADLTSVRRGPVRYQDALNMTRVLIKDLVGGADAKLLSDEAASYWSEHGDRAQLPSWAACCGASRPALDALGRWKASSSAEYTRTARQLILSTQLLVTTTIKENLDKKDVLGEEVIYEGLRKHLVDKGVAPGVVESQVRTLRSFKPLAEGAQEVESKLEIAETLVQDAEASEAANHEQIGPYIVSISMRAQVRCLHKVRGCWRRAGIDFANFEDHGSSRAKAKFNRVCKQCWPDGLGGDQEEEGEKSAPSCSASSASSSSDSEE
jgi:hypothetical protein